MTNNLRTVLVEIESLLPGDIILVEGQLKVIESLCANVNAYTLRFLDGSGYQKSNKTDGSIWFEKVFVTSKVTEVETQ